jgi:hypothetical protein
MRKAVQVAPEIVQVATEKHSGNNRHPRKQMRGGSKPGLAPLVGYHYPTVPSVLLRDILLFFFFFFFCAPGIWDILLLIHGFFIVLEEQ